MMLLCTYDPPGLLRNVTQSFQLVSQVTPPGTLNINFLFFWYMKMIFIFNLFNDPHWALLISNKNVVLTWMKNLKMCDIFLKIVKKLITWKWNIYWFILLFLFVCFLFFSQLFLLLCCHKIRFYQTFFESFILFLYFIEILQKIR